MGLNLARYILDRGVKETHEYVLGDRCVAHRKMDVNYIFENKLDAVSIRLLPSAPTAAEATNQDGDWRFIGREL